MLSRLRRFAVIACAATLSVLAIAQSGQAYDQICINNQCGAMVPTGQISEQVSYQTQDYSGENDTGVEWVTPPAQQLPPPTPPVEQPPPIQPPTQEASTSCVYFHPLVPAEQRRAVCNTIAKAPDLKDSVSSVDATVQDYEIPGGWGNASASAGMGDKRILIYPTGQKPGGFNEESAAHELAHNKALDVYHSSNIPENSDFYRAWIAEGGVTSYGGRNPDEGFAEAYAMAVTGDPTLDNYPQTKAVIERVRAGGAG